MAQSNTLIVECIPGDDFDFECSPCRLSRPQRYRLWFALERAGLGDLVVLPPALSAAALLMSQLNDGGATLDERLIDEALDFGILHVRGLETISQVVADLDSVDDHEVDRFVRDVLDAFCQRPPHWSNVKRTVIDGWRAGQDFTVELRELPSLHGALLERRNRRWLPQLVEASREGAFVAVGAAHLPGPVGLLALLESEGFSIGVL